MQHNGISNPSVNSIQCYRHGTFQDISHGTESPIRMQEYCGPFFPGTGHVSGAACLQRGDPLSWYCGQRSLAVLIDNRISVSVYDGSVLRFVALLLIINRVLCSLQPHLNA